MVRKEAVANQYRQIAKQLLVLHTEGTEHISRQDNNWVIAVAQAFEGLAQRIDAEYGFADPPITPKENKK